MPHYTESDNTSFLILTNTLSDYLPPSSNPHKHGILFFLKTIANIYMQEIIYYYCVTFNFFDN